jgi:8-oxo-dGTP diphosphatase
VALDNAAMAHPMRIVCVAGLVTNPLGQVLLVKTPARGWEFPGGQVEESEPLTDALVREIEEESGVRAKIGPLTGVYTNISPPSKVMFQFLAEWISGEVRATEESLETRWVDRADALGMVTHPAYIDRMRDMLEFNGSVVYRVYESRPAYRALQHAAF